MPYREQILCAFCDGMEVSQCPRCGCRLCKDHQPTSEEGWCWACAKEVKDERDIAVFAATVHTPNERRHDGSLVPIAIWAEVAGWIALVRQRRRHRKVVDRTPEEIEAWRREAGIRTRW